MPKPTHFSPALFRFLNDLKKNNDKAWFAENKDRYEDKVREPALQFISDFGPKLRKVSPHFLAVPKKVGGSMFRIHRDVRFSKDKSPYKTQVGIHFRHKAHKDAHAPGFYLHLAPKDCFVGAGIWRPDGPALKQIRQGIVGDAGGWKKVKSSQALKKGFELSGDSLKRPPRGFDPEHPHLEDLKRKDFIAVLNLKQSEVTQAGFLDTFSSYCRQTTPLVRWLCKSLEFDF